MRIMRDNVKGKLHATMGTEKIASRPKTGYVQVYHYKASIRPALNEELRLFTYYDRL